MPWAGFRWHNGINLSLKRRALLSSISPGLGRLRRLSRHVVDFFFPPVCANCDRVGRLICKDCREAVAWLAQPLCMRCGRPTRTTVLRCHACRTRPFPLRQIRAATLFAGPVPRIIHQFKYRGAFALAEPLADWMAEAWPQWQTPVDLMLPIPLHCERERERGYNQSDLLVRQLAARLGYATDAGALSRPRQTQPQASLRAAARQNNVRGVFEASPARVTGKHILLVDDVYTTGATLREAGLALVTAGAASVTGYCAAQATDS